jgi:AraC-type DNA-binding domain-containing proteins
MIARHNTLLSTTISSKEADFSAKLLDAIQKLYKDPDLDVHTLAEAMDTNRSALNEKIQNALGMTTAQFIRTYRLNVAKEMICNGTNKDMNISEIAYEVGFKTPSISPAASPRSSTPRLPTYSRSTIENLSEITIFASETELTTTRYVSFA